MEKNYDPVLDFILEKLIAEYENHYKGLSFYSEEIPKSVKENITQLTIDQFNLKEWEINIMLYTLLIDKFIKSVDPLTISLEGLVFRNNGGYVQKSLREKSEAIKIEKIQNDFRKYSFGLMMFTAIVAFGTLISAWFFAIEIYKYYFEAVK